MVKQVFLTVAAMSRAVPWQDQIHNIAKAIQSQIVNATDGSDDSILRERNANHADAPPPFVVDGDDDEDVDDDDCTLGAVTRAIGPVWAPTPRTTAHRRHA